MTQTQAKKPCITFLFSDTGGGHRSGASAIIEALNLEFPGRVETRMVDLFREYTPSPFKYAPDIYPTLSRYPDMWRIGYHAIDGRRRMIALYNITWPYVRRSLYRMLDENPCDMLVSVHQLMNGPVLRALYQHRINIPFATVVLDMVSTVAAWFDPRANLILVPTETARQNGIRLGVMPERIQVAGMPVAQRFVKPAVEKPALRQRLGWRQDLPMILIVGGGEGMGNLEEVALAIDFAHVPAQLAVVCGRNTVLKERLKAHNWSLPTFIYGFVSEMPDFMGAADVLVTKAGPGTISEAFIAGLPLVLYSKMPGQEDGNVTYVVDEGAGVWAPEAFQVVDTLKDWLSNPLKFKQVARASKALARPESSRIIARALGAQVGLK